MINLEDKVRNNCEMQIRKLKIYRLEYINLDRFLRHDHVTFEKKNMNMFILTFNVLKVLL